MIRHEDVEKEVKSQRKGGLRRARMRVAYRGCWH